MAMCFRVLLLAFYLAPVVWGLQACKWPGCVVHEIKQQAALWVKDGEYVTSALWGKAGEGFKSGGRLLDWSYAGYAAGELPIPSLEPTANVKDYGARGDGLKDDTKAFRSAIAANAQGVLYIPPGRYVIRGFLNISTRLSLKGAGSKRTTLVFPQSLAELYGDAGSRTGASQWSFGTGFINYKGRPAAVTDTWIGSVTKFARRGTNGLQLSSVAGVEVGQWVRVTIGNRGTDNLLLNMNMGLDRGCVYNASIRCFSKDMYSFHSRVAAIKVNSTLGTQTLVLERPLPYNISTAFAPAAVYRWAPHLANIGVEGITFEMNSTKYQGHFKETGFNALDISSLSNAWVRDVAVIGADNGLIITSCNFVTVTNITLTAPVGRAGTKGWTGHHGLFSVGNSDVLYSNFSFDTKFVHDLSVDFFSHGDVWSQGRGVDLNMDHHRAQTYGILWTQLDMGLAERPFESGGAKGRGLHAGSLTTFWNLNTVDGRRFGRSPASDFGPALNFIGCGPNARYPSGDGLTSSWRIEAMQPGDLQPPNLFLAQQALRLASPNKVSPLLGGRGKGGQPLTAL